MNAKFVESIRLEPMTHDCWNAAFGQFADSNFQQSWAYADILAARRSCMHEEVGVWSDGELVGLASVRVRKLPFVGLGVAYIAGGPLVNRGAEGDLLRFRMCLERLREEYVRKRKLTLRILPPTGDSRWNQGANTTMAELGMSQSRSGRSYRTFLLDLRRPLDEIRKNLAQKWRNCLNASEKVGFSIRWTTEPDAFEAFRARHESFVRSKGFSVDLDAAFYASIRNHASDATRLELAVVEMDDKPVAIHLGSYLGDTAVYLLGLTEEAALESKAAYFLHWEVIKKAHQLGMAWYDLGGIDPEENPGVFKFKAGFRGEDVLAAGPMEFDPGVLRRSLLRAIEKGLSLRRS